MLDTIAFLTSVAPGHYGYFHGKGQGRGGGYLILLSPEHANIISRHGWTKESVKRYIWQRAKIPANRHTNQMRLLHEDVVPNHWKWLLELPDSEWEKILLPVVETPDLYQVVVVGGPVGKTLTFSCGNQFQPIEVKYNVKQDA